MENAQKRKTAREVFRSLSLRDRSLARLYFFLTWLVPDWLVKRLINREADRGRHERRELTNQRLGLDLPPAPDAPLIWLHAIGPGDATAIHALADALLDQAPSHHILITTRTPAAYDMLQTRIDSERVTIALAPHDTYRAMVRFLDHWQPELAVFGEGDFWPNGLLQSAKRGIKIAIVNASIVSRLGNELRRAPALGRWLMTYVDYIHLYSAQCVADAAAWVPDSTRLSHLPNLKMASAPLPEDSDLSKAIRDIWGDAPVITFGSLANSEIAFALDVYARAKAKIPTLKAIIAPRWIKQGSAVATACAASPFSYVQRSVTRLPQPDTDILIADTYGEMGVWYRRGLAAYVGGTLNNGAGHNPFEPAILGTPVLAGSLTKVFSEDFTYLATIGACTVSDDAATLAQAIVGIHTDRTEAGNGLPPLNELRAQTSVALSEQLLTLIAASD